MSQDIFQFKIDETYDDCEGTIGISDDITCHGKGDRQQEATYRNGADAKGQLVFEL